jgi:hypothetical protein
MEGVSQDHARSWYTITLRQQERGRRLLCEVVGGQQLLVLVVMDR